MTASQARFARTLAALIKNGARIMTVEQAEIAGYHALTLGFRLRHERPMLEHVLADMRRGNISHVLVKQTDGVAVWRRGFWQCSPLLLAAMQTKAGTKKKGRKGRDAGEALVLESLRVMAERFKPELFEMFQWPFAQIVEDSPLRVGERDPEDQFRTWLKLWPAHCTVWIGDVYSSGKPEHRTHFRPIADWYQIGPVMGNYTCGSSFKPGSYRRSNENLNGQRFLVIESDTLAKDEVGAVFAYLRRRLRYRLHCIIDTAGKSLHAWFDAPRTKFFETRLKAGLIAFGCDPKVFTYSQPVRVPGAFREGRLQRLVWLEN